MYDTNKDGLINYTEFAAMLFERQEAAPPASAKKSESQPASYLAFFARARITTLRRAEATLELLRKKVAARGARGILGLSKLFRIMDDDRSGKLNMEEFTKAIKEYKLGIEESDIQELFKFFDRDHSGQVCYDEFLRAIRVRFLRLLLWLQQPKIKNS